MNNIEKSAALLAQPIIGDGQRFTYFLMPENQFLLLDTEKNNSDTPLQRVEANGTGLFCDWMLTENFVIIRRKNGTYVSKGRPPVDTSFGAMAYSRVFGFSSDKEDFIIFSSEQATFVVRVGETSFSEETLILDAICYCGYASIDDDYCLLGQSLKSLEVPAEAVNVTISSNRVKIEKIASVQPLNVKVNAAIATFLINESRFIVYAKEQKSILPNDLKLKSTTLKSDHSEFLICELNKKEPLFLELEDLAFVSCVGPFGKEAPFFCPSSIKNQTGEMLFSVDSNLNIFTCKIEDAKVARSIANLIYDSRIGYLALIKSNESKEEHAFALSDNGDLWELRQLLR